MRYLEDAGRLLDGKRRENFVVERKNMKKIYEPRGMIEENIKKETRKEDEIKKCRKELRLKPTGCDETNTTKRREKKKEKKKRREQFFLKG